MDNQFMYRLPYCCLNGKIVFASAFFYCLAFIALDWLSWCIFPALFLLFIALYKNNSILLAIRFGFLWGMVVYGFHAGLIFYSLYVIKPCRTIIFLWLLAMLYLTFYAMALFLISVIIQKIMRAVCSYNWLRIIARSAFILIFIGMHFYLIERHALFIFGVTGGCPLISPLVPCAHYCPAFCEHDVSRYIGIIRTDYKPCRDVDPLVCLTNFFTSVACERCKNHAVQIIITPESALPFSLNTYPKLLKMLCDYSFSIPLLIGSFYDNKNCCYYFCDGALRQVYMKQHAMPYVEMIPWVCDAYEHQPLFQRVSFPLVCDDTIFSLYPLICSEVFCADMISSVPENSFALVMVNDTWFADSLLVRAAYSYAYFKAYWHNKPMIYVSFYHGLGILLKE